MYQLGIYCLPRTGRQAGLVLDGRVRRGKSARL